MALFGLLVQQAGAYSLDTAFDENEIPREAPLRQLQRTPLELLANDKESKSVLISRRDVEAAEQALGDLGAARPRLEAIAQVIAPQVFSAQKSCEALVLGEIERLNTELKLTADPRDLRPVLTAMREQSLIDDLIFLPLSRALPAYLESPRYTPPPPPQPAPPKSDEEIKAEEAKAKAEFDALSPAAQRARTLFTGLLGICPTDAYLTLRGRLQEEIGLRKFGKSDVKNEIRNAARAGELSDAEEAWFMNLHRARFDEAPFTTSQVAPKIRAAKNVHLKEDRSRTEPNSLSPRKKKKSGGLSHRILLYKNFNAEQIKALANIFFRYHWRVNHLKTAKIVMEFEGDEEIGPDGQKTEWVPVERVLDAKGQANLMLAELYSAMHDDTVRDSRLSRDVNFHDDVIIAVMETGYRDGADLERILRIDEVWNPKISTWDKVIQVITRYGGPALVIVPPPWNAISSMALALINSDLLKGGKDADRQEPNFPIF